MLYASNILCCDNVDIINETFLKYLFCLLSIWQKSEISLTQQNDESAKLEALWRIVNYPILWPILIIALWCGINFIEPFQNQQCTADKLYYSDSAIACKQSPFISEEWSVSLRMIKPLIIGAGVTTLLTFAGVIATWSVIYSSSVGGEDLLNSYRRSVEVHNIIISNVLYF